MLSRSLHILLAGLIYISATGFVVQSHFCRSELKDVSLFSRPESCHAKKSDKVCPFHQQAEKSGDNNCCQNKAKLVKEKFDWKSNTDYTELPSLQFVNWAATAQPVQISTPASDRSYLLFRPPIVVADIPVLYQSFLL